VPAYHMTNIYCLYILLLDMKNVKVSEIHCEIQNSTFKSCWHRHLEKKKKRRKRDFNSLTSLDHSLVSFISSCDVTHDYRIVKRWLQKRIEWSRAPASSTMVASLAPCTHVVVQNYLNSSSGISFHEHLTPRVHKCTCWQIIIHIQIKYFF
jgi:hypothetical protein